MGNRLMRGVGSSVWAISDQAAFALSHLGLNLLLARWLTPEEYGSFTVLYSMVLLVGSAHIGLFSEPAVVLGAQVYRKANSRYLGALVYGHVLLTLVGMIAVALASALASSFDHNAIGASILLTLTASCIFLQWLLRHGCYSRQQPRLAATAGTAYMVVVLVGTAVLQGGGTLTDWSALALVGTASLIVSVPLAMRLGIQFPSWPERRFTLVVWQDHWRYGRWAIPTRALMYVPTNGFYLVLPLFGDVAASGALRALMNTVMPVLQAFASLSTLLSGVLARTKGSREFRKLVMTTLFVLTGAALLYWPAIGISGEWLMDLLYEGRYTDMSDLLWILGALPVLAAISTVLGAGLRSIQRPDRIFWGHAAATGCAVTIGLSLVAQFQLTGAAVAMVVCMSVATAVLAIMFRTAPDRG